MLICAPEILYFDVKTNHTSWLLEMGNFLSGMVFNTVLIVFN